MFVAIVTGIALIATSPGVNHPLEVQLRDIHTMAECRQAGAGLIEIMRANAQGNIRDLTYKCKPQ